MVDGVVSVGRCCWWRLVDICCGLCSGGKEGKELLKRSKLPKLLERVKATFPDDTTRAHELANFALSILSGSELLGDD